MNLLSSSSSTQSSNWKLFGLIFLCIILFFTIQAMYYKTGLFKNFSLFRKMEHFQSKVDPNRVYSIDNKSLYSLLSEYDEIQKEIREKKKWL